MTLAKKHTIDVVVVDNEEFGREKVKSMVLAHPRMHLVGEATNGLEAIKQIVALSPDVVFLDVEMPHLNGIEVARSLVGKKPLIIFVTAFDQYAIAAFELHAVDYLLKPITKERMEKTISRIEQILARGGPFAYESFLNHNDSFLEGRRISFDDGKDMVIITMDDISHVIMESRYVSLHYDSKNVLLSDSLANIFQRLDPAYFLFVHRNAIVNMAHVARVKRKGLRDYMVVLEQPPGAEIAISRSRVAAIKQWLKDHTHSKI